MFNAEYICNPSNDSLSKLMNMGVDKAQTDYVSDYVCIVTQGVEFTTRLTEQFVKDFEADPLHVIVGGLLFYPDGRIQHGGGRRFWNYSAMGHYGQGKLPHQAKLCLIPAYRLYVTGATAAVRKSWWQDHKYDEVLTCSCEDTDLCFRAWKDGKKVFYDPLITTIHNEGMTRGRTVEEKIQKSPLLYQREMDTHKIFMDRYSDADALEIDKQVNKLNVALHPELTIGFVRNGATGDVLRTLEVYDQYFKDTPRRKPVVITQVQEAFRDRECAAITSQEEEYAVSGFINLDMAYERRRDLTMEQAYASVALGIEDVKTEPTRIKASALDWFAARNLEPGFDWGKKYVVVHMGSGWPGKVMPVEFWQYIIHHIRQKGFPVVGIGSGGDYAPRGEGIISLNGRTNLHMLRAVCEHAALYIGNDSGPLHVADGACPAIGLFTLNYPKNIVSDNVTGIMTKAECGACQLKRPLATDYKCQYEPNDQRFCMCSVMFDTKEILKTAFELMGAK
jgi:hypothetical protein